MLLKASCKLSRVVANFQRMSKFTWFWIQMFSILFIYIVDKVTKFCLWILTINPRSKRNIKKLLIWTLILKKEKKLIFPQRMKHTKSSWTLSNINKNSYNFCILNNIFISSFHCFIWDSMRNLKLNCFWWKAKKTHCCFWWKAKKTVKTLLEGSLKAPYIKLLWPKTQFKFYSNKNQAITI